MAEQFSTHVNDGGVMDNQLREARKLRGWTVPQLIHEMKIAADRLQLVIASDGSLRVMISNWENGRRQPDDTNLAVLQAAFDLPAEALGFHSETSDETSSDGRATALVARAASRMHLTESMSRYLSGQLDQHMEIDNLAGPGFVLSTVEQQLRTITDLVGRPETSVPSEGYALACRFHEFAGWLLQDSGQFQTALTMTNKAIDFAKVAGREDLLAYCIMRKSNILQGLGQQPTAVATAYEAAALAETHAPDLLAVCHRQAALAAASAGQEFAAAQALDTALTIAHDAHSPLDPYCKPPYVQMEATQCWLSLGRIEKAIASCEAALDSWPVELVRDESLCASRLALAYGLANRVEEACQAAEQALDLIQKAPSARAISTLHQAARVLLPYRHAKAVRALRQAITQVG